MTATPTTGEQFEAKAVAALEDFREPLRAALRRRLGADDQRRRREVAADREENRAAE